MFNFIRPLSICAVATLLVANTAHALTDDQYLAAYRHLQRAQGGDKGAIPEAVSAFEALHKAEPGNPLALVNLGASSTMRARTTLIPWDKMSYTEEGLAHIDKALALLKPEHDAQVQNGTPVSLSVKFIAANTWLAIPTFFAKAPRGEKLLNEVLNSPLLEQASLQTRGAVWLRAGRLAQAQKRPDDARRLVGQIIEAGAPQLDQARTLLGEIEASATPVTQ